ncbi:hypothetical protein M3Y99_00420500 [Aphelenchoides fujianensis]|nr:hypothetical protein M3Y99_00420500 [Aphelenchoides fujianensis]
MINGKLAVLLLVAVVAVSALDDVPNHHRRVARASGVDPHQRGPRPDHEQVKPFEFLGEKNEHHRVARSHKVPIGPRPDTRDFDSPFEFLDTKDEHRRVARISGVDPHQRGPRPEPVNVKPFEFLGGDKDDHRVARGVAPETLPTLPPVETSASNGNSH